MGAPGPLICSRPGQLGTAVHKHGALLVQTNYSKSHPEVTAPARSGCPQQRADMAFSRRLTQI